MSNERPSKKNRIDKFSRSFKETFSPFKQKFTSLFHPSRPPTPSSIDMDSAYDNHTSTADIGSNLLPKIVPVITIENTEVSLMSSPISVTAPTSIHAPPRQFASATIPGPETPLMHMSPNTNTHTPMSLFQGAHNVYMQQPTITMANSVQNVSFAGGSERLRPQIFAALSEKLLPRAQSAEYDAASPAPRNACTKNTRKAILDTLQVWASDNATTKVYWLNGMAGTGKTTIAYSFSEILDEKNSLGGTFFSSHLRPDTSDVHCIIPTISLQLAKYLPSFSQLILDVVEANPDCKSWRIGKQFMNFIVRPLTVAYRNAGEVVIVPVIVLDALDECSDQSLVTELLSMILKHSASLPVKFFITSRPEIRLQESFDNSSHSNFILHEVEKEIVRADIDLHIKACLVDGQIRLKRHDWPPQAEIERLVNMSGTLFIYAATVCKYITQNGSPSMPQRLLDVVKFASETTFGVTQPLNYLYKRILDTAYDSSNPRERLNIDRVLGAVVYAYNPLSMIAISVLVQMPMEQIEAALSLLHSLVYIPSSQHPTKNISIFHASFYDFISNQVLSSKHYLDPCISHKFLALQCLSLMDKKWSGNEIVSYLAERRCEDISESLAYACGSWAFHFTHRDNNSESAELKHFLEAHLLRWVDCLSILGKLGFAMDSLRKLESWAGSQNPLTARVIDAKRFIKENFDFIKNKSLEGCPSALAWLPEKSDIWKTYGGTKMDCPWKLCCGRREIWSLSEAVLEHSSRVNSAVFSSDGTHIVTASDHSAHIWNTATGECEAELKGHSDWINCAVFSPDDSQVVTASVDNNAKIWNTATGECEAELKGHIYSVNPAVFSPDGMHVVTADHFARIWNTATGECEAELQGHSGWINSAVFSPDGMHIATASDDKTAHIWNSYTGKCEAELKGHSHWVYSAAFSPNSMHVVTASFDRTAKIWNTATGECEAQLQRDSGWLSSAAFSPDGMHVVTASYDYSAEIWNAITGKREARLGRSSNNSSVFSSDGMHVVTASRDHTARIWNTATGKCKKELQGHSASVYSAVFSPDGTHVVTASGDHTARIWNTITGEDNAEEELKGQSSWVNSAVFSSDCMLVVTISNDFTAKIWNTITGVCEAELEGYINAVKSADFSPNGMHVATASGSHTARIWTTATGKCIKELIGHSSLVNSAVFSSDGMHVATTSEDCTAIIWNTATEKCKKVLKGHLDWVNFAVFSPDGMHVVTTSGDHTARIWNTATGECKEELKGHSASVNSAVFSPDGMHVVTTSKDHTARIWNMAAGDCETELKGHSDWVKSAVFSPDGMHVVTASVDNTARIWNTATGGCEAELKGHTSIPESLSDKSHLHDVSLIPAGIFVHNDFNGKIHVSLNPSFLAICKDTIFHTKNLQKIWVPPHFRKPTSISYHLSKIYLVYGSGEILVLQFQTSS